MLRRMMVVAPGPLREAGISPNCPLAPLPPALACRRYVNPETGKPAPLLSEETWKVVEENKERLNSHVIYDRDFNFQYFGFKTLERSYLLKLNGRVAERPQHMYMRVAIGIHGGDIDAAIETYNHMSMGKFTHASPTLFNAGTPKPQMSSCFLLTMEEDSIEVRPRACVRRRRECARFRAAAAVRCSPSGWPDRASTRRSRPAP